MSASRTGTAGDVVRAAGAVLRRPRMWTTAVTQFVRLVPDGWWRHRPFLPLPDPAMLRFRATTQYGDPDHRLEPADLIAWLGWCRAENRRARGNTEIASRPVR